MISSGRWTNRCHGPPRSASYPAATATGRESIPFNGTPASAMSITNCAQRSPTGLESHVGQVGRVPLRSTLAAGWHTGAAWSEEMASLNFLRCSARPRREFGFRTGPRKPKTFLLGPIVFLAVARQVETPNIAQKVRPLRPPNEASRPFAPVAGEESRCKLRDVATRLRSKGP